MRYGCRLPCLFLSLYLSQTASRYGALIGGERVEETEELAIFPGSSHSENGISAGAQEAQGKRVRSVKHKIVRQADYRAQHILALPGCVCPFDIKAFSPTVMLRYPQISPGMHTDWTCLGSLAFGQVSRSSSFLFPALSLHYMSVLMVASPESALLVNVCIQNPISRTIIIPLTHEFFSLFTPPTNRVSSHPQG